MRKLKIPVSIASFFKLLLLLIISYLKIVFLTNIKITIIFFVFVARKNVIGL